METLEILLQKSKGKGKVIIILSQIASFFYSFKKYILFIIKYCFGDNITMADVFLSP